MANRRNPQPEVEEERPTYEASELIAAAYQHFGVKPDVMAGALYGVDKATKEEAETLIKAYLSKEVN